MISTKLWLLRLNNAVGPKYDIAQGFVVRAGSPKEARKLASAEAGDEGADVWLSAERSSCKVLKQDGRQGVILRDFLAG